MYSTVSFWLEYWYDSLVIFIVKANALLTTFAVKYKPVDQF